jgi:small subunit ribosomal protein S1
MLVDGKEVDFDSLFEDEESTAASASAAQGAGGHVRANQGADIAEWWKEVKPASVAHKSLRPGDSIEVAVVTVGTDNLLFSGKDSGHDPDYGRIEGVVSRDDFTAEQLADLKSGSLLKVFVVSVARKGDVLSVEGSLEARKAGSAGGSVEAFREAMASGVPVTGKVTGENKGGFEVALQGGKGFVPFSQIDAGTRLPSDQYIGQSFQFLVTRVEGRNIVLSRAALQRQEQEAGREKFLASVEPGQVMQATVRKIESFGLFVELGFGVSALVPQSEAAWSRGQALHTRFTPGETVTVKILKFESFQGKPRISASIKQADADPWDNLPDFISPQRMVTGTVTRLAEFGAFVEIAPGIEALLHISEMSSKRRIHRPAEVVQPGQQIQVRVTAVDRIKKRIGVSLKDEVQPASGHAGAAAKAVDPDEVVPTTISIAAKGSSGSALAAAFLNAGNKSGKKPG